MDNLRSPQGIALGVRDVRVEKEERVTHTVVSDPDRGLPE